MTDAEPILLTIAALAVFALGGVVGWWLCDWAFTRERKV